MEKVYCKNCKYSEFLKCRYFDKKKIYNSFNGSYEENISYGQMYKIANENGECKHYKRKWWKLWIK